MKEQIVAILKQIAEDKTIQILYACETGSRAWGYPSPNSDYDIFFIYIQRPIYKYLDMDKLPDGMDRNTEKGLKDYCTPELEFRGYDIYKAARLFRNSNPQMIEWIQCPAEDVYIEETDFVQGLRALLPDVSAKKVGHFHYNQMLHNYKDYIQREEFASAKKYLVVLRGILACMYLVERKEIPPFKFDTLLQACESQIHPEMMQEILNVIRKKQTSCEIVKGDNNPIINDFIEYQITMLRPHINGTDEKQPDTEDLNRLILETLGF